MDIVNEKRSLSHKAPSSDIESSLRESCLKPENEISPKNTLNEINEEKPKKGIKKLFGKKGKPVQEDDKLPPVPFFKLFRFTTPRERKILIIGAIFSFLSGLSQPAMTFIFSNMVGSFISYGNIPPDLITQADRDHLNYETRKYCLIFLGLAVYTSIVAYIQNVSFSIVSEKQALRMREEYYIAALRQNMGWFDKVPGGDLTTRLSSDISVVQDGIGVKLAYLIQYLATFIFGLILAFVRGWKMALVVVSIIPLIMVVGTFMGINAGRLAKQAQSDYAKSGVIANEAFSSMRTIMAFNGQSRELDRYNKSIAVALVTELRKAKTFAFGLGGIFFFIYIMYSLGFWFGAKEIRNGSSDPSKVLNVFFALIIGGFSLGGAAPSISAVTSARGAAASVFDVIDRESPINPLDTEKGIKVNTFEGDIEFNNVVFSYPTRTENRALDNFSIKIKPGQKVALVGESGCGKSTTIGLIQRFYDVDEGSVKIDGIDVREYNVRSLRQNMGIVSQEPVLFDTTILRNVQFGAKDLESSSPTEDEVIQACKDANIHDFIMSLPEKYNTIVGERGAKLSGGQKQRIAIARSLIRNPQILLLDEATSALDTESERLVQDALDRSSRNRTTITVAHRLSTIKDSDMIYVCSKGQVIEYGNHEDLISKNGAYTALVNAQNIKGESADPSTTTALTQDLPLKNIEIKKHMSLESGSSLKKEESEDVKVSKKTGMYLLYKIYTSNPRSTLLFIPAFIGSIIYGALFPVFSIFFSKILVAFGEPDLAKQKRDTDKYSLLFLIFAIIVFFSVSCRTYFFSLGSIGIAKKVRNDFYFNLINQDSEFFDKKENGTGILTTRLSSEPEDVFKFGSDSFPMLLSAFTSLVTGVIIAFCRSWKLTLIILSVIPILAYSQAMNSRSVTGRVKQSKNVSESGAKEAAEAISNIRTVAGLTREPTFIDNFCESNVIPYKLAVRSCYLGGISYGFSQCAIFLIYALTFYCGSRFILNGSLTPVRMFNTLYAIVFASTALGQASQFLGFIPKALVSAVKLNESLEMVPKINIRSADGESPSDINGKIVGTDIKFNYPSRMDVKVLKSINLHVKPGQTVGLVGSSGSGKSTIINLALRLYDVLDGSVKLEDVDVRDWNLPRLRSEPTLVSQEPSLFDVSIAENIRYGKPDATQQELEIAAKAANIHKVIMDLPDGYETRVGANGGQLSGGQKQRMAIARALVRNPKILLLDEATSALDTESERLVQGALDEASIGRTTISIAHRLSTIQNADWIYVFDKGEIIEQGTHNDLLGLRGTYYSLVVQQSLTKM
ncbi:Multidrug resistance protein 1 [Smittium mucronatum]|uniref:Multidrug resistance protein 1 n=1 Tax=Smittium mucronatum TaxID=133383 RepID=A0A1R0GXM3_9FUNG|nr:Multidrug resistance protein 1 [Smittium mucronatum]